MEYELTKHQVLRREFWCRTYAEIVRATLVVATPYTTLDASLEAARIGADKALAHFDARWSELPEGEGV